MTKENFDALYNTDVKTAGGNIMKQFVSNDPTAAAGKEIGEITFVEDQLGTTNHVFNWTISEKELEELTHDQTLPREITRYVRFIGKTGAACDYLYVKLTVKLSRNENGSVAMAKKIDNYWFAHADGATNGWDNVVFDVSHPYDGGGVSSWTANIPSTITGNHAWYDGLHKYYFVPTEVTVTATEGTRDGKSHVYRISPVTSSLDNGNYLYCKYITTPVADRHAFTTNYAELEKLLNDCAIDYDKGAFANTKLYASKDGGAWKQIATLTPGTGEIVLDRSEDLCKEIVNAVGYEANHTNINTEFNTMVGVVAKNGCGVAKNVEDEYTKSSMFYASFERPLNFLFKDAKTVYDAATNGEWINLIDCIELFDWRGPVAGEMMSKPNRWIWAFYNVNSITIHMDDCLTTLGDGTWQKLTDITGAAELWAVNKNGNMSKTGDVACGFNFRSPNHYNEAGRSESLYNYMEGNPKVFGRLFYQNNGDNVTEFKVKVPVTVGYEWGEFTKTVEFTVKTTLGQ